ncbi:MAG: beta-N-acetylhexosaminidase [Cellvibrionales bacterium]|nr:MAG: beta-N-acetylhexosaminidase [Cellvibrionales bacterium]
MLDLEGTSLTDGERELLTQSPVGGVIFFARNISSKEQFIALTTEVSALRPELLLAIDQEGGRVQRLREGYTILPPMQVLGNLLVEDSQRGTELLRDTGWLLAVEMIASGLDFSFAPVLDLDSSHCEVIANRSFSLDPGTASAAAGYFIEGMAEAGMAATGKHFPGHGGVTADSHLEIPYDSRSLEQLQDRDLLPFKALSHKLQGIMPAHIVFPEVDDKAVGFSSYWLQDILRQELAFDGVIFSDDLSMKGADQMGSYAEKADAALRAGCDMVLVCNNRQGALEVLDFLQASTEHVTSPRLPGMKTQAQWQWAELMSDVRWLATREALSILN